MNINITDPIQVQLCEEDRHRLDAIIVHLTLIGNYLKDSGTPFQVPAGFEAQETKEELPGQMSFDEIPAPAEPEKAPWAEAEPAPEVKQSDIQKKVVSLSAAGKKDQVRTIITSYAVRVSDIPEDKYSEVWTKLTALEG